MTTLLAFDNDGVFNLFSKSAKDATRTKVGPWPIAYREDVLARVRGLLAREDVTGVWLTTWLEDKALLSELEHRLGLDGLVTLRAPHFDSSGGVGEFVANPAFDGHTGDRPDRADWWKFRSWELLLEDLKPERAAWLDDDLGRAQAKAVTHLRPQVTPERFLYKTHSTAGLLHSDVDKLEAWLDA
jgi:hypothetical protein